MKVVIIGGVAAGTKVAAKLKRENPEDEIVIYTKGKDISYAGCGLPYYIGGAIETEGELIVNTPQKFMGLTGTEVYTESEVTAVDPAAKTIQVQGDGARTVSYDKLVIAVGAESSVPPVEGTSLPGVFTVRTPQDAINARKYAVEKECRRAVVVGGGFIGLEVAENLMARGISVTVVDMASQLMPNIFDPLHTAQTPGKGDADFNRNRIESYRRAGCGEQCADKRGKSACGYGDSGGRHPTCHEVSGGHRT